jgi:L-ascorbate metabolism protein UlaG (beta-lactamase superfamily)
MNITWKGQSCFQVVSQKSKTNPVTIVIDPFSEEIGLRGSFGQADIVLITHNHSDHNNAKGVSGDPFVIDGPGEYEVKEIYVQGIPSFHDGVEGKDHGLNTIYIVEAEDLRICHLGDIGQKELTEEQLDKIGDIDILMIPVGGNFSVDAKEAVKIMGQIEPRITIPMHYALPRLKMKLEGVDNFLKILGIKSIVPENKLSIKKKDISIEEAKIVVLKP